MGKLSLFILLSALSLNLFAAPYRSTEAPTGQLYPARGYVTEADVERLASQYPSDDLRGYLLVSQSTQINFEFGSLLAISEVLPSLPESEGLKALGPIYFLKTLVGNSTRPVSCNPKLMINPGQNIPFTTAISSPFKAIDSRRTSETSLTLLLSNTHSNLLELECQLIGKKLGQPDIVVSDIVSNLQRLGVRITN